MADKTSRQTPLCANPVLFPLGDLVATPDALSLLERHRINPLSLVGRHLQGDWGIVNESDRKANDDALKSGNRILSSYTVGEKDRVWIISTADRSSTCILTPSEY